MLAAALCAGALTSGAFAYFIEDARLPDHRWERMRPEEIMGLASVTFSIALIALCLWLIRNRRGWLWRTLSAVVAIIGIVAALFSALLLYQQTHLAEFMAAYVFALFSVVMVGIAVYVKTHLKATGPRT
jgi:drug/metabolite transporter (DMT)-like permease